MNQVTATLHELIHWIIGSITGSGIVGVADLVVAIGLAVYASIRRFRRVKAWSLNLSGNDGGIRVRLEISTPPPPLKKSKRPPASSGGGERNHGKK